jgi:hypothetical protein
MVIVKEREFQLSLRRVLIVVDQWYLETLRMLLKG